MKKLMKKKVNVFGKKLPVFMIVLLGIAVVSAALVPYLSNVITGLVTVDSPLTLDFGLLGDECLGNAETGFSCNIYGGDIVSTTGTLTNKANVVTEGVIAIVFYDTDGKGIVFSSPYFNPLNQIKHYTDGASNYYIVLQGGYFNGEDVVVSDNHMAAGSSSGPMTGTVTFATNIKPQSYDIKIRAIVEGKTVAEIISAMIV